MHIQTHSEMSYTDHLNASVITALHTVYQESYTKLNSCNFKKGRMEEPENYRSVSLTSVPRMTVEQILLEDISKHLRDTKVTENSWCNVALPRQTFDGKTGSAEEEEQCVPFTLTLGRSSTSSHTVPLQ